MKTEPPKKPSKKRQDKLEHINEYAKYSGLAFQMIASLLLGLWLGMKIDRWLEMKNPVFTIIMILLFLFTSFYLIIRSLPKS